MKESKWKYLRELYEVSQPTQTSGYFQISASIDNVKMFLYTSKRVIVTLMAFDMKKQLLIKLVLFH